MSILGGRCAPVVPMTQSDQPLKFPTRDVIVDTESDSGNGSLFLERTYYLASEQKIRHETNSGPSYLLILEDMKNRKMTQIDLKSHSVVPDIPMPDTSQIVYRRLGTEELIAGIKCTDWASTPIIQDLPNGWGMRATPKVDVTDTQCISDDGIVLKTDAAMTVSGRMTHVITEAKGVIYGPLNPKLFSVQ
jgi:hypothetical protein